jgi:hypothetical protein
VVCVSRKMNLSWIEWLYNSCLYIQWAAYPTPNPDGSKIHGRHNGFFLNFQAKIPTEIMAKMTTMIFGSILF